MSKSIVSEEYLKNFAEKQQFIGWWQTLRTKSQEDIEVLFDHRQDDITFNYSSDASGVAGWHKIPIIHCDLNRIVEKNVLEVPYTEVYDDDWTYESFGFADYPHELKISRYSYQLGIFHAPRVIEKWTEMCRELFRKYVLDLY